MVRVLWFTNNSAGYSISNNAYNGGGWISSMRVELTKCSDIQLGIAFLLWGSKKEKDEVNGVTYYPLDFPHPKLTIMDRVKKRLHLQKKIEVYNEESEKPFVDKFLAVIDDYKPDVIHIFGSEFYFGLVSKYAHIPIVLHVQGIISPCLNAFLPPFVSWEQYESMLDGHRSRVNFEHAHEREKIILSNVHNYIGRTTWDERIIKVFNPSANYFYGGEVLRDVFYREGDRILPEELTIVSTISGAFYKGYDLVLKTAKLLKEQMKLNFKWLLYGNIKPEGIENIIGICHVDVNVELKGVASAEQLKESLLTSTCYVHPSYIDNSPNSVCEAQIIGCPVVATNVGGVSSLIEDGCTGYLVPANDPYQMAYLIGNLYKNPSRNKSMGAEAKKVAMQRHNKETIVADLLKVYYLLCGK